MRGSYILLQDEDDGLETIIEMLEFARVVFLIFEVTIVLIVGKVEGGDIYLCQGRKQTSKKRGVRFFSTNKCGPL